MATPTEFMEDILGMWTNADAEAFPAWAPAPTAVAAVAPAVAHPGGSRGTS